MRSTFSHLKRTKWLIVTTNIKQIFPRQARSIRGLPCSPSYPCVMTAILSASRRHCLVSKRYDTRSLWLLVNCDSLRTSSWISAWKEERERGERKGMGLSANVKDPVRVRCVRCAQITAADRFGCSVRPGCRGKVVASCLFSPGLVLTPHSTSTPLRPR